jgi:hypothetical protein
MRDETFAGLEPTARRCSSKENQGNSRMESHFQHMHLEQEQEPV